MVTFRLGGWRHLARVAARSDSASNSTVVSGPGALIADDDDAGTRFVGHRLDPHRVMEKAAYSVNYKGSCIAGGPDYAFKAQQRGAIASDNPTEAWRQVVPVQRTIVFNQPGAYRRAMRGPAAKLGSVRPPA